MTHPMLRLLAPVLLLSVACQTGGFGDSADAEGNAPLAIDGDVTTVAFDERLLGVIPDKGAPCPTNTMTVDLTSWQASWGCGASTRVLSQAEQAELKALFRTITYEALTSATCQADGNDGELRTMTTTHPSGQELYSEYAISCFAMRKARELGKALTALKGYAH